MAQLQHMDAHLDTLSIEFYQVNVLTGRIARRQAIMGGFAPKASPPPPPMVFDFDSEDEDADDGDENDASNDDDGDANSIDEMST